MSDFIQLHFLTPYGPSNLNRDDLGRPKTAVIGGCQRLRISSQSLKRAWRTSDVFAEAVGEKIGKRTKDMGNRVYDRLVEGKVDPERAHEIARKIADRFGKVKAAAKKKDTSADAMAASRQTEQLAHFSVRELASIDALLRDVMGGKEPTDDDIHGLLSDGYGTADIAMFGRMLAAAPSSNVEAAVQVAHAFSVNKAAVEDDFFTAVDDLNTGEEDVGAGHLGTSEFGAGVFYHYVCIDRGLLASNLQEDVALASEATQALVSACVTVSPSGKQATFASRARPMFMLAERGAEQPRSLAAAFFRPVAGEDQMTAAIEALRTTRERMDAVYGKCWDTEASFDVTRGEGTLDDVLKLVAD